MDLDNNSTDIDSRSTRSAEPPILGPDAANPSDDPTVTLPQRDRSEAESSLLFGLLALANGLIEPESLTKALGAWAGSPGRPLREALVEQGQLDEPDASVIAALASRHLVQHHGIAWESLIALCKSVRFRIDPSEVADSELRGILAGFISEPASSSDTGAGHGLSPRYKIIRHHARGGLGVISLAQDREIHREVAVKEIRDDCAHDPDYKARFLREAEVTGRLEHPGIVPVYGMGFHDDGRPYYIMRFIRGETLKVAIARLHKPAGEGEAAGMVEGPDLHHLVGRFIDACHAVAYAHHRKILHRDLKPINIMLGPFGETLVVDWGLAKAFDGSRSGESPVEEGTLRPESGSELTPTRVGSQVGTTGYMSPEQSMGLLDELGPTSDIFSLGATLFCLITGHAPFEGAGKDEFLRRVQVGDFPEPSKVNPSVPRALEAICLKAMALRPVDRYQSVGELIEDLERWSAGSPVLAYPEPPIDRLARWAKRHKTALTSAAVLLVCTTIGLAVYAAKEREDNVKLETARLLAERARADSDANRMTTLRALKSILKEVNGADLAFLARSEKLRDRMASDLVNSYRHILRRDRTDKKVQFDLAQACQLKANIGRSMGKFDSSRDLYSESIGLLESLGEWNARPYDLRFELVTLHNDAGENYRMAGKPREAIEEYRKGLETLRRAANPGRSGSEDQRIEARLQLDLAGALSDRGLFDEAEEENQRALDLLKPQATGPAPDRTERLLLIYSSLGRGNILRIRREFKEASEQLGDAERRARELMAAFSDPDTRFAFAAVRNEQGFLLLKADPESSRGPALTAFQDAHEQLDPLCKVLPEIVEFQRCLGATLNGRGLCNLDLKNMKQARDDFSSARSIFERLDQKISGHFGHLGQVGWTIANLSRTYRTDGTAQARELLLKAAGYLGLSVEANPDCPVYKELRTEVRRDLIELQEGAAVPPPGP